jgi:hypothetical protein
MLDAADTQKIVPLVEYVFVNMRHHNGDPKA